jgi:hypothetical protein
MGRGCRFVVRLALAAALLPASAAGAFAQDARVTSTTEFDRLFDELLRDPSNAALNRHFAEVAEQRGDLEAAIGALERLLITEPDQPLVRLKIGQLYARIGSAAAARAYLEPLAAGRDVPPEVRQSSQEALGAIGGGASPHHFSATVLAGAQWQTNPGAAPASSAFLVGGANTPASPFLSKRSDSDVFAQGTGRYSYDLATPYHDAIVVNGIGYDSSFRRQHQLDTTLGEVSLGPRFGTERFGVPNGTLRPYALVSAVRLGGAPYYYGYGGGLDYAQDLGAGLPRLDYNYEAQEENYHATLNYPAARQFNGRLDHYEIDVTEPLGRASRAGVSAVFNRQGARIGGYRNSDFGIAATLSLGYAAGALPFIYPCITSFSVARHYVAYDAPDPAVSPTITRTDRRWQFSVTEILPITDRLAVAAVLYRDIDSSTVINYSYGNTSFLVGPQLTF